MTITTLTPIETEEAYRLVAENSFLSGKQLAHVLQMSTATANRRLKQMKEKFEVKKYQKINLLQVCNFFDLDVKQAVERL